MEGGVGPETSQVLANIADILVAAGAPLSALTKINVYLHANTPERFAAMNKAYIEFFESRGVTELPPRITVGCVGLALGANVEMDAVAHVPCSHTPCSKL